MQPLLQAWKNVFFAIGCTVNDIALMIILGVLVPNPAVYLGILVWLVLMSVNLGFDILQIAIDYEASKKADSKLFGPTI